MRLTLEITETRDGKHIFRAYDDIDRELSDICGSGWSVRDAVDDFIEQARKEAFHDDDTPVVIIRETVCIARRRFLSVPR